MGLVPAPTVVGADHRERAFAILLYGLDPIYLTSKKQVLDRALALIACVRCGEISGGKTPIRMPEHLLTALMDPRRNYTLGSHSSTPRQYAPLIRMGMITLVTGVYGWGARLVPTSDNLEAVRLARTLLQRRGEEIPERGLELYVSGNEAGLRNLEQIKKSFETLARHQAQEDISVSVLPPYFRNLLEIVTRCVRRPNAVAKLARRAEWLVIGQLVGNLGTPPWKFNDDDLICSKLLGDIAQFMVRASSLKMSFLEFYLDLLQDSHAEHENDQNANNMHSTVPDNCRAGHGSASNRDNIHSEVSNDYQGYEQRTTSEEKQKRLSEDKEV